MDLFTMKDDYQTKWASFENPGAEKGLGGKLNKGAKGAPFANVDPGKSIDLMDFEACGIIHRIWMTVDNINEKSLRAIKLDFYWDRCKTPAVSVPLGDFFGSLGGEIPTFENALFSSPEGRSFNCSIPMPFRTHAKVVLTNESDISHRIFYDINFSSMKSIDKNALYFHAHWRRENPTKMGEDFEILPLVAGRGRFLGSHITVLNVAGNPDWWGEGEVKAYLDGDKDFPSLIGSGTEDYIGTGWGQKFYANQNQGCLISDEENGRQGFYRYHIPDPVFFHKDFRITIQQMGGSSKGKILSAGEKGMNVQLCSVIGEDDKLHNFLDGTSKIDIDTVNSDSFTTYFREDDLSAVAFFYLDRPENGLPLIADVGKRIEKRWINPEYSSKNDKKDKTD